MKAYAVLKKYGWIQRSFGDKDHGFCAIGAIDQAYSGKSSVNATNKFQAYISKKYKATFIIGWNDRKCRTKQQVLGAFRAAKI